MGSTLFDRDGFVLCALTDTGVFYLRNDGVDIARVGMVEEVV